MPLIVAILEHANIIIMLLQAYILRNDYVSIFSDVGSEISSPSCVYLRAPFFRPGNSASQRINTYVGSADMRMNLLFYLTSDKEVRMNRRLHHQGARILREFIRSWPLAISVRIFSDSRHFALLVEAVNVFLLNKPPSTRALVRFD